MPRGRACQGGVRARRGAFDFSLRINFSISVCNKFYYAEGSLII